MEIPYIVTPRKDTGLFNSKIAIWLFLASEVMLFGGLFSAYIFLRIGADYPWPERTLPVIPGLINTFILIASSVTVVFAWASLKLRQWGRFRLFMGITVACAVLFMVLKSVEYSVKFHHQAVRLKDHSIVEGHLAYALKEGANHHAPKADDYELDHHGKKIEENVIKIEAEAVSFDVLRYYKPWVEELISQAEHHGSKLVLAEDVTAKTQINREGKADPPVVLAKAGEALSLELLKKMKEAHLKARGHNASMRTESLREEWAKVKDANPGKRGWQLVDQVAVNQKAIESQLLTEIATVSFKADPACVLLFKPRDIREADGESKLRDATIIKGKLLPSPMDFHYVDAIDFQFLAMKAVERGVDPMVAIENSWLIKNSAFVREAWAWHQEKIAKLEKKLADDYGMSDEIGADGQPKPNREPTFKERYRMGWSDLAAMAEDKKRTNIGTWTFGEEFKGPNYDARGNVTFPSMEIPREQVAFASKFMPAWNTYYAIYFTITGLHGLHVIGGALVLAYYLFFTRKMFETDPEWLANRVEVAGLFWHFVDLVWIFAFPIFYLM